MISLSNWLSFLMESFTFYGGGKGGGDAPESPDYAALVKQQANAQIAINQDTTKANRINQYTPWGSLTYSQAGSTPSFDQSGYDAAMRAYQQQARPQQQRMGDGRDGLGAAFAGQMAVANQNRGISGTGGSMAPPTREQFMTGGTGNGQWSSNMTLNPELQKILDNQFSTQQQRYTQLQDYLKNIQDPNKVNAAPINPGQTAQDAIMARLQPTFNQTEEADRTRLYNQGVRPGTEAWDNEMRNFNMARNDAYSQAALQGIGLDTQARQNSLLEQGLPLNAINSFLSGSSVQNPGFGQYAQQANAAAPDLMGAAQQNYAGQLNSYNAQQANSGNMMGGLMSMGGTVLGGMFGGPAGAYTGGALGGALGGGGGGSFSDIRLKSNIVKVGEHPKGFGIYEYDIFDRRERGVMAQEVEQVIPDAVFTDVSGYKKVNYEVING